MPSPQLNRRTFFAAAGATAAGMALMNTPSAFAGAARAVPIAAQLPLALQRAAADPSTPQAILENLSNLRFGMFNHYNLGTYTNEEWAAPRQSPTLFAPPSVDCDQWADAAVSAKMNYGVLTTKHHDGFALWPTAYGTQNVMHSPYPHDIVEQYVTAFRSRGLKVGLYFSIWDRTHPVQAFGGYHVNDATAGVDPVMMDYVTGQITELLTRYGTIDMLVTDGWSWQMGQQPVSYPKIRELVRSLQPDCVMIDIGGLSTPWLSDAIFWEEPLGITTPAGNTFAGMQGQTISNGWFWHPSTPTETGMSKADILSHITDLESKWTSFILNCPPNRNGKLDNNIVAKLAEVGAAWSPNLSRPALPLQPLRCEHPINPIAAYASAFRATEGPYWAIDGRSDKDSETCWSTWPGTLELALPQTITVDLGGVWDNVSTLEYLPKQWRRNNSTDGDVTSYAVSLSNDGIAFTQVVSGTWAGDINVKLAEWAPRSAGFLRFEAKAGTGGYANVGGLRIGGRQIKPSRQAGTLPANHTFRISNAASGKTAQVTQNPAAVNQGPWTAQPSQQWTLTPVDGGYYALRVADDTLTLQIPGRSRTDGTAAGIGPYANLLQQHWALTPTPQGYILTNRFSNLALGVESASTQDGAKLIQTTFTSRTHQLWRLEDLTDVTPPISTLTISPPAPASGWHTGPVTVTAEASDDRPGTIRLEIDSGAGWVDYNSPLKLTSDGTYEVKIRSTDSAGNVSEIRGSTIRIDQVPPVSSATIDKDDRSVTVHAADNTSGLDLIQYKIGQDNWSTYTQPVTVPGAEAVTVSYRSIDKAGNTEPDRTVRMPAINAPMAETTTAATAATGWVYGSAGTIAARVSGPAGPPTGTVEIRLNQTLRGTGPLTQGRTTIPVTGLPAGRHTLIAMYLGNASFAPSSDTVDVTVTKADSTVTAKLSASTVPYGTSAVLTAKVSAAGGAPNGKVTVKSGSTTLASGVLTNGVARITLRNTLSVKVHTLNIVYSGTTDVVGSTTTTSLTVAKATSVTKIVNAPVALNRKTSTKVLVAVATNSQSPATGALTFTVTQKGVKKLSGTGIVKNGACSFSLPGLGVAGKYLVTVNFLGGSTISASAATFVTTAK